MILFESTIINIFHSGRDTGWTTRELSLGLTLDTTALTKYESMLNSVPNPPWVKGGIGREQRLAHSMTRTIHFLNLSETV